MLAFAELDWTGPVPVPERLPNGGLFTGELAKGEWGAVSLEPTVGAYVNFAARVQPPGAVGQQVPDPRPGSHVEMLYRQPVGPQYPGHLCFNPRQ